MKKSIYEIKQVLFEPSVKEPPRKRKRYCPLCGNEMKGKIVNGIRFCEVCHRLIGPAPHPTDETPIKQLDIQ